MAANIFGTHFQMMSFGESHGPALGVVIDGCPSGVPFHLHVLEEFLAARRPGSSGAVSGRQETDSPDILSGVHFVSETTGETLGTPIAMLVRNHDARPADYEPAAVNRRRGHADDLFSEKFSTPVLTGGGRASGRETVARVMAGAVAQMFVQEMLSEIRLSAFVSGIGPHELAPEERHELALTFPARSALWASAVRCPSEPMAERMVDLLQAARESGESYGGTIDLVIGGLPRGLGQPVFHKLKGDMAAAMMSIGASNAVEFGEGASARHRRGTEFHTQFDQDVYGGMRGGISTGEPLFLRVAFKPTSTIGSLARQGRHDPCIVPRAVVVAEAMAWLVLADHLLWQRLDRCR